MFKNLFNKSSFGLDIRDESIKFIELKSTDNGIAIGRYGEIHIEEGVLDQGKIKDVTKFKKVLESLRKDLGLRSVHFSISNGYMPYIQEYLSAFETLGITVDSFEHSSQSLSRAVLKKGDTETSMIVDFGKKYTDIFVMSKGALISLSNLEFSGDIARSKDEIAKHFINWHTSKKAGKITSPIRKIVISGPAVKLTELSEYLSMNLRNKVEVANVWINILDPGKNIPEISFEDSFNFAHALGLALRDFIPDPTL